MKRELDISAKLSANIIEPVVKIRKNVEKRERSDSSDTWQMQSHPKICWISSRVTILHHKNMLEHTPKM